MKNILYLHGMASSHTSETAAQIQKYLPDVKVWVPDLSINPEIAFPQINQFLKEHDIDLIVGHSLGGFMAQKYRGRKKILLNPSLGMSYMYLFQGDNHYKTPRIDGNQIWHVDKSMCRIYKQMQKIQYDGLTTEEDDLTFAFFGRVDFMTRLSAHWFKQHYTHRQFMPGGHNPPETSIRDCVVPQIKKMLGL